MKFWKFSSAALAALLASVSLVSASGPTDGDAIADPNSAVVKLTTKEFQSFLEENPLVLAEFFAPWCGYCKALGPEFAEAANSLNESNPNIKLAQVDCTEEEELCAQYGIRGYPTLKVFRGENSEDYAGSRDASGIADYMIKQSLPPVVEIATEEEFETVFAAQDKPFIVQVYNPSFDQASNETYVEVANEQRKDYNFLSINSPELVKVLNGKINVNLNKVKSPKYLLIHPSDLQDTREFTGKEVTAEALNTFIATEVVPYFGDINRDTYMMYMSSPVPLGYYFYKTPEQRAEVDSLFNKLGKEHRGKINFVGLDANMFGRHAEILSMNPEIVPLFVIQNIEANKKYGIDQASHPDGPSAKEITKFVKDFLNDKLTPIVKSEDLPTEEEKQAQSVIKMVGHNHDEILKDLSKDVFVKYYAPWCGHCKRLAPVWEELAGIYGSNKDDAQVVIANIDHTANDVDLEIEIEGYPTLVLYPANGKVDAKTGFRESVVFSGGRDLESLIDFIKTSGGLGIDGQALKDATEGVVEEDEEEENAHDEL